MRLDVFLVEKKLAASRTLAQDLIDAGHIILKKDLKKIILDKSSYQVKEQDSNHIFVEDNDLQKYVSRGGLKLEAAINFLKLNLKNKVAFDVGQSTGGFTDCLIHTGVRQVIGIDVGHAQLHQKIKGYGNVISFEGLHVKDLAANKKFNSAVPSGGFDLIVIDVSFISLTKVMPDIKNYLKNGGDFLFLVKPQFELDEKALDKNGIVKNSKSYNKVQAQVEQEAHQCFGSVLSYFKSEKLGKDGNQEFFIYGQKTN